jgi:benzoyl-CoA reductase/2-hydroxyglutaryl-CoA dehydratase subunit BcrC/BadD/HgdB
MYSELLKLCGYQLDEIKSEKSRIERAFKIMEIGPEDIQRAEKRISRYIWVDSSGMRRVLGIYMKDMIDLVLAEVEGKKTVYTSYPPIREITALAALSSDNVVGACPEVLVITVMGFIFGKLNPYLELAESLVLKRGYTFCSLLQARMGAIAKGLIPKPTLLIPSGLLCDQAPKTDEMLHEMYGSSSAYIDCVWDEGKDEYPVVSPRRVKYLAKEMEAAAHDFANMAGFALTEERVQDVISQQVTLNTAWEKLLWKTFADPMPLNRFNRDLAFNVAGMSCRHCVEEGPEVMEILQDDVQQRIDDGFGINPKGSPRVWLLVSNMYDPSITAVIEELGMQLPLGLDILPDELRYVSNYDNFWEQRADINLRIGSRRSATAYCKQILSACREFQLDGIILIYHVPCRMYDIFPPMLKHMAKKELGIPILLMEGNWFESRDYTAEGYRTKLESFAEIVKGYASKMKPTRKSLKKPTSEDFKWFSAK